MPRRRNGPARETRTVKATTRIGVSMILCLGALTAARAFDAAPQVVPPPAPPTNVRVETNATSLSGFPGTGTRPYSASSPWNTPIPANAAIDANSGAMIATVSANGNLRSDPSQYTYPVYIADSTTPRTTMTCTGTVSTNNPDGTRATSSTKQMAGVPIPSNATASTGTDAQMIIIDTNSGDEYDIWQFVRPSGCANMTKYVQGAKRGATETSYMSRGAGVPYFAGLVRPFEIAQGHIDHALAFAYKGVRSGRCVWPASKTDGSSTGTDSIPEGARLQLDPSLDVTTIPGLSAAGQIIARALQQYGAYVIDYSGSNKLYPESTITAPWGTTLTATTVSPIPVSRLRVLQLPGAYWASTYAPSWGGCVQ